VPAEKENTHRQLLSVHKLEDLFMLNEDRVLSKDLSFQYKKQIYQIDFMEKKFTYMNLKVRSK